MPSTDRQNPRKSAHTGRRPQRVPPPRASGPALRAGSAPTAVATDPGCTTLPTDPLPLQAQLENLEKRFADLKGQLRQLQKLAMLGTTAAMIAHEINNLLTPIMAYARHALDAGDPEAMRNALSKTLDCSRAMTQMVDRVVGFARQSDGATKTVRIRGVVEDALGCLARDFTKDQIDVKLQVEDDLAARANENQLLQVLVNLITNARKAMLGQRGRGRLTIRAQPRSEDDVVIEVADTGCGIPAEHIERVFDPFFSTQAHVDKPDRRGLGLGLPICRDIVQELGGTITLTSKVGAGTTFTLTLPRAD